MFCATEYSNISHDTPNVPVQIDQSELQDGTYNTIYDTTKNTSICDGYNDDFISKLACDCNYDFESF